MPEHTHIHTFIYIYIISVFASLNTILKMFEIEAAYESCASQNSNRSAQYASIMLRTSALKTSRTSGYRWQHTFYCDTLTILELWLLDGIWIGWLDLLNTYTHNSELQAVTAIWLIYALYKSLGQAKSSQSSLVVSWQRIYNILTVTTANISLHFTGWLSTENWTRCHLHSIILDCRLKRFPQFYISWGADPTENAFSIVIA
jgi:hypothetical protein